MGRMLLRWRGSRGVWSSRLFTVVFGVLMVMPSAAQAGPVRLSDDCAEVRPAGYSNLPRNGDPFVFLATRSTRSQARGLQRVMRDRRIFQMWTRDFHVDGNPGRPLGPGGGRRFEIVVAPHNNEFFRVTHADGADMRACDAHGHQDVHHDVVVVADNLASEPGPRGRIDWSVNVLAHELFHAFQGGAEGHYPNEGLWWIEATAEWAGDDIFGFPHGSTREHDLDVSLFRHPELPLDLLVRSGPEYETRHAYAVWRFVQYLHMLMPSSGDDRLFGYLVRTFQAIGHGASTDEAIQTAFPAAIPFGEDPGGHAGFTVALGTFWTRHLPPDLGDQLPGGPVTLADSVGVPEIDPGGGPGQVTANWDGDAPPLGIRTVELEVGGNITDVWVMPGSASPPDDFVGINGCLRWAAPIDSSSYFGLPVPGGQNRLALVFVNTEPGEAHLHVNLQAINTESAPRC